MTRIMTSTANGVGRVAVVALVLAACAQAESAAVPTSTTTTTTSTTTTTTTTSTTTSTTTTSTLPPLPVPGLPIGPPPGQPVEVLGTIAIPKLELATDLYEGISLAVLDNGPGHWPGTALPGQWGNVVVGGHRTSHDRPFRYLDRLEPGDEIIYTTMAGQFVYLVTAVIIVDESDVWIADQTPAFTTTLFACHPPGSTRQRIVVQATLKDA